MYTFELLSSMRALLDHRGAFRTLALGIHRPVTGGGCPAACTLSSRHELEGLGDHRLR